MVEWYRWVCSVEGIVLGYSKRPSSDDELFVR